MGRATLIYCCILEMNCAQPAFPRITPDAKDSPVPTAHHYAPLTPGRARKS